MKITHENYERERIALYAAFQNPQTQRAAFAHIMLELGSFDESIHKDTFTYFLKRAENSESCASIFASLPAHDQAASAEEHFLKGSCLHYGIGTNVDHEKAAASYRTSAEQQYAPAQNTLGYCYQYGEGVPKNLETAVEWFAKAAEQGHAMAQNNLGFCYLNGEGVPKNLETAIEWIAKATEQGDAPAQNNLGVCYYYANGVPKDLAKAVKWYAKAADQGLAAAQNHLPELKLILQTDQLIAHALITAAIDKENYYAQNQADIDNMLTAFMQRHYIDPETLPRDGRLEKFTATLKHTIAPYQDDGAIAQNHPLIFAELKESRAFADPKSEQEIPTIGHEQAIRIRKIGLPNELGANILTFLGQCGETAASLAEFPLWSWAKAHFIDYSKGFDMRGNSHLKLSFNSKPARDAFLKHYNPLQMEELLNDGAKVELKDKSTSSLTIHCPPTLSDKNRQNLAEMESNLERILKSKIPNHVERLQASRASSASSASATRPPAA